MRPSCNIDSTQYYRRIQDRIDRAPFEFRDRLFRGVSYALTPYIWYKGGQYLYRGGRAAMAYLRSGKRTRPTSRMTPRRRVRRRLSQRGTTLPQVSRSRFRTSGVGVTDHFDRKTVYRKHRMPRWRRRRWRSFTRKVKTISEKEYGTRTVVYNVSATFSNTTSGNQTNGSVYLYGQNSTTSYAADLAQIGALETQQAINAPTVDYNVDKTTKILFQSAVLDITVRNTSFFTTLGTLTGTDARLRMEVDAYECTVKRSAMDDITPILTFGSLLNFGTSDTFDIPGAPASLTITLRGTTPFDVPDALSRFGIKIWKKTKYILNNGEAFTYQIRDPKRRVCTHESLLKTAGFNRPGWTRVVFFLGKLLPGIVPVGTLDGQATEQLTLGITRKYMYKVEGINANGDAYGVQ